MSRNVIGLTLLLKLGKLARGDYYDCLAEFVMQQVLKKNSNCVDIGCHLGDVLAPMLRLAPEGRFFAFEPLPSLFKQLQFRFGKDERIRLYNVALSEAAGAECFQYVLNAPAYSGFLRTDEKRPKDMVQTIMVEKASLDDVLKGVDVDLIKLDVEGAELQVLRGGLKTLRRCRPYVIFEHAEHARYYDTKPDDVFDLLNGECGLRVSLLSSFLRRRRSLTKNEFIGATRSEYYFLAHR
jgi:methyltransferase, FkbM family